MGKAISVTSGFATCRISKLNNDFMNRLKTLYHASPNSEIDIFEPRNESIRNVGEGPVVFATPDKALASTFLVPSDESWVLVGRWSESGEAGPWHVIVKSRYKFMRLDSGGAIYHLPGDGFIYRPDEGLGENEWISTEKVRPLKKEIVEFGLKAMIENGVEVYFVGRRVYREIKKSEDDGMEIVSKLKPESL